MNYNPLGGSYNYGPARSSGGNVLTGLGNVAKSVARSTLDNYVLTPTINTLNAGIGILDGIAQASGPRFGPRTALTNNNMFDLRNSGRLTEISEGSQKAYVVRYTDDFGIDKKEYYASQLHTQRGQASTRSYQSLGVAPIYVHDKNLAEVAFNNAKIRGTNTAIAGVDFGLSVAPGTSDARDVIEFTSGRNAVTQQPLTGWQKTLTGVGMALPVVGGAFLRRVLGGADEASTKTYQTYTKTHSTTGEVYVGRTSGTGTPLENVARRDSGHEKNALGYGPAQLDRSSDNYAAIRGREQTMIELHGGARSSGGTSANQYNGISPRNSRLTEYLDAARKAFGL